MQFRMSLKWILGAAIMVYAVTPAGAQTAGGTAGGTAAAGGTATVGFQRKTQLTPQEQVAESDRHIARMTQAGSAVRKQLEEARRQRDVVKTLCLNDKVSQIDVAIRSARDRRGQLGAAAGRNDVETANHQFTILTVLRQRAEQLTIEANQCIGEESAFLGDTRIKTTIDPSIPPDDDRYPPTDPSLVAPPPFCTSCTL